MFIVEFFDICKFILMSEFFCRFLGSSLSNRGAKSKNEFAATENHWTKGVGHVTKNFRKIRIFAGAENRFFCWDISFPSTSVYFSGSAGGRSLRARVLYMTRRAVLPKSNTAPGLICAVCG